MSFKKIIMTVLLVAFLIVIAVVVYKVNQKSVQTLGKKQDVTANKTATNGVIPSVETEGKDVRKGKTDVEADMDNIIEIKDNYFIQQTNDIYINIDEYIGKTVKIEGYVYTYDDENGKICYGVVRNTPGCCGNDGLAGLDFRYDKEYPEVLAWVEVIGVISREMSYGSEIPVINAVSVTPKEEGVTFVTN